MTASAPAPDDRTEANAGSELSAVSWGWWLLVLLGLLGIAVGVIVIVEPNISLATLAWITGIFLLIDGIMELLLALLYPVENRGLAAIFGVVSALAGVVLLRHPFGTVVVVALLLGLWLIVAGVLRLVRLFDERENRLWSGILALLELVAGIVIVAVPGIGVATLALLVGIAWILRGAMLAAVGWGLRGLRRSAGQTLTGAAQAS